MLIWAKERIPSGLKIEKASGSSQENFLESSLSMTSGQILGQGKLLKKIIYRVWVLFTCPHNLIRSHSTAF